MSPLRNSSEIGASELAYDLHQLARAVPALAGVRRSDLLAGDWVVVTTRNSRYVLAALDGGAFSVSGGWFDLRGESPRQVEIDGCTFGGRAIIPELVAAPGLFLELGNGVRTTRIQSVQVFPSRDDAPAC